MSLVYNLVLVGDKKVGKTTFINRHLTGVFSAEHARAKMQGELLFFKTENLRGRDGRRGIYFRVYENEADSELVTVDCAVIMFDVTDAESLKTVTARRKHIVETYGEIPIVVCGNKVDLPNKIPSKTIRHQFDGKVDDYYDVSSKSNYNFEKPFLNLARCLMDDDTIEFYC